MLDSIIEVVKSWPSEWCLEANKWAIQVLGGSGCDTRPAARSLPRPFPNPSPTLPARSPSCSLLSQLHSPPRYVHDYPVEQLYRDNRLNMIHEGST
mmetsp:Transcript_11836/g.35481  ORF Transcript_11836/g.35481 Transcript_11836/m.35481 type:complete len:96 (-) Transcript_11836:443-730(-)